MTIQPQFRLLVAVFFFFSFGERWNECCREMMMIVDEPFVERGSYDTTQTQTEHKLSDVLLCAPSTLEFPLIRLAFSPAFARECCSAKV